VGEIFINSCRCSQSIMVETKSLEQSTKNWKQAQSLVPSRYKDGVMAASNVIAKSIAAEARYAEGVQKAAANQSRAKALANVTDQDWKNKASTDGAQRIAQGMANAEPQFRAGMADVLNTLQSVQLPERTSDPMNNLINRAGPIVQALSNMKKK
ncbi:MAG: hypothetical protein QMD85_01445, partial [Candidatus Aenigmarchaeota archaeon]|nr:hypothetical protein [Candidatus Aenigmarchaeota archaeon]